MASTNTTGFEEMRRITTNELRELVKSAEDTAIILHRLANEIDEICKQSNDGKITGSEASLAGLPLLALGFAFPVLTTGLLIAGGILSGVGGIKTAYHNLKELSITRSKCSEAQRAVDAVCERAKAFKESVKRLEELDLSSSLSSILKDQGPAYSRLAVGFLVESGVAVLVTTFGSQILYSGYRGTVAMAPFDIYTITQCTIKKNSNNWSPKANKIRDLAREMHELAQEGNASLTQLTHNDQA